MPCLFLTRGADEPASLQQRSWCISCRFYQMLRHKHAQTQWLSTRSVSFVYWCLVPWQTGLGSSLPGPAGSGTPGCQEANFGRLCGGAGRPALCSGRRPLCSHLAPFATGVLFLNQQAGGSQGRGDVIHTLHSNVAPCSKGREVVHGGGAWGAVLMSPWGGFPSPCRPWGQRAGLPQAQPRPPSWAPLGEAGAGRREGGGSGLLLPALQGAGSGRAGGLTVAGAGQSGPDARAFR